MATLARSVLGTAVFLALSLTVGRRIVFSLIRWTNDNFVSELPVVTAILVIMGVMALITHMIGVHAVLGAFVAGMLVGESPILTRHIDEQLRGLILAIFMPVFFGTAGLSADLVVVLKDPHLLLLTLGLIAIATIGKFAGAFLGGELGGLSRREALALATGMNARGSSEVIVATIGLSRGALSQDLFTMIVTMAIVTTLAMPPTLRWALARLPIRKEEKERLEREEMEARGFVSKLERLLVAVDDSANGQFGTRVAGMIAGTRSMPTTVMHITPKKTGASKKSEAKKSDDAKEKEKAAEEEAQDRAEAAAEVAFATARAARAPVTVLYVAPPATGGRKRSRRMADAMLKDLVALGESYDVDAKTAVRTENMADEAVLKEIEKRKHNLIVM